MQRYEKPPPEHSLRQIESARANNCLIACYAWAYRSYDPVRTVNQAMELAIRSNVQPKCILLDCETYNPTRLKVEDPGPDAAWLAVAFDECVKLGLQPAIYSGLWWLTGYLKDLAVLKDVWLWLMQYNGIRDLKSVDLIDGLDRMMLVGHQYTSEPYDLNVMLSSVFTR